MKSVLRAIGLSQKKSQRNNSATVGEEHPLFRVSELLVKIFLEVDLLELEMLEGTSHKPTEVVTLGQVCKLWREVANSNSVWKTIVERRWKLFHLDDSIHSWKRFYQKSSLVLDQWASKQNVVRR